MVCRNPHCKRLKNHSTIKEWVGKGGLLCGPFFSSSFFGAIVSLRISNSGWNNSITTTLRRPNPKKRKKSRKWFTLKYVPVKLSGDHTQSMLKCFIFTKPKYFACTKEMLSKRETKNRKKPFQINHIDRLKWCILAICLIDCKPFPTR